MGKTALFLAGGAPNLTLTSGALLALHEELVLKRGIEFDIVSMAGAGAVVGLMYLRPSGMTKEEALHSTKGFGISDLIYSTLPINYKVFAKSGAAADFFNDYWASLPEVQAAQRQYGMTQTEQLQADTLLLEGAIACPTDVDYFSQGFCGHPRFLDNVIDFVALRAMQHPYIEVNAFRLDGPQKDRGPCDFKAREMTPDHLRAALSFPFIYPPYEIDGLHYFEGAAFQVVNPLDLRKGGAKLSEIDRFIFLNPMKREFIQSPRNLWDAYAQSIMMPLAALSELGMGSIQQHLQGTLGPHLEAVLQALDEQDVDIPLFMLPYFEHYQKKMYVADFQVPPEHLPYVFDWSRSNLETLFECGYTAGIRLADRIIQGE
jgi:NTE family protein